jgi:hypothetical protein
LVLREGLRYMAHAVASRYPNEHAVEVKNHRVGVGVVCQMIYRAKHGCFSLDKGITPMF